MTSAKAPRPWSLTENETPSSFDSWRDNLEYYLSCDSDFAPFLDPTNPTTWEKSSSNNALRGLKDDAAEPKTKATEKLKHLKRMLGLIPQWVPTFLASDIRQNSTSISSIWNMVRKYYQFEKSEVNFMKFSSISMEDGERPERLYQRIIAHLQDNLLEKDSGMIYDGEKVKENETMSPTVYRLAIVRWMELVHPKLPQLVCRTYAHDLQTMSLRDLQPQICRAISGFLEEIKAEDTQIDISKAYITDYKRRSQPQRRPNKQPYQDPHKQPYQRPPIRLPKPECRICKAEGRVYTHSLASCNYLSKAEKSSLVKSFRVESADNDLDDYPEDEMDDPQLQDDPSS
jgi:hypothetical protein